MKNKSNSIPLKTYLLSEVGDVELFGLVWKGGVYMASFAIRSLTLKAKPENSTSPSETASKKLGVLVNLSYGFKKPRLSG